MADLDILTPDEARAAVFRTNETITDILTEQLGVMVTAISGGIDRVLGPVVQREATVKFSGGASSLLILATPVAEIDTVTVDGVELDEEEFELETDGHYAVLHRLVGDYAGTFNYGTRNVEVVFQRGRFATTEDVDETFKGLCRSVLRARWQIEAPAYTRQVNPADDEGFLPASVTIERFCLEQVPNELLPPGCA